MEGIRRQSGSRTIRNSTDSTDSTDSIDSTMNQLLAEQFIEGYETRRRRRRGNARPARGVNVRFRSLPARSYGERRRSSSITMRTRCARERASIFSITRAR